MNTYESEVFLEVSEYEDFDQAANDLDAATLQWEALVGDTIHTLVSIEFLEFDSSNPPQACFLVVYQVEGEELELY